MILCERCGKTYELGEWPWCPHGTPSFVVSRSGVDPNLTGDDHTVVDGITHRNRLMKENNLAYRDKRGKPGQEV